jgi:hypothetical protein
MSAHGLALDRSKASKALLTSCTFGAETIIPGRVDAQASEVRATASTQSEVTPKCSTDARGELGTLVSREKKKVFLLELSVAFVDDDFNETR